MLGSAPSKRNLPAWAEARKGKLRASPAAFTKRHCIMIVRIHQPTPERRASSSRLVFRLQVSLHPLRSPRSGGYQPATRMDPVRSRVAIPAADPPDNITHEPWTPFGAGMP